MKRLVLFALVSLAFISCQKNKQRDSGAPENIENNIENVILLIGDGMGLSQVSASFFFQEDPSNFERFPYTGIIKTSSSRQKITDSAAGATAFSTGEKTYNGAIGVNDQGAPLTNIIEILSRKNYKTGLVATSSITHATPAAFYAKAELRKQEELIASQLVTSDVDFFAGGGAKFFTQRSDGDNLLEALTNNGFEVDTSKLDLGKSLSPDRKYGYLLAPKGMPKMTEGRSTFLPDATQQAIDYLSQQTESFFLMVEGSQIDWGGHANDAIYLVAEVLDFDRTVGVALDFAAKNTNTLVIVTADHETGGFTLSSKAGDYDAIQPTFSTGGHSATLIPVFAYGPGAEKFTGIYENTSIFHKIMALIEE